MAFQFFGVFSQGTNGIGYRFGFYDNDNYMPILERRDNNSWIEVNYRQGTESAGETCRQIRSNLPIQIPFPNGRTQNERMELINQIIYKSLYN